MYRGRAAVEAPRSRRMTAGFNFGGLMRSLRAIALTAVLTVSASLLVTPPAFARPTWVPPAKLGAEARHFDMDVNSAGAAVSAWFGGDVLKASYRPAGRDWSRPVVLARDMPDLTTRTSSPSVPSWTRGVGLRWSLTSVAIAPPSSLGRRGDPGVRITTVGGGGIWSSFPTADMDAAGHLVLTWVESDDLAGDHAYIAWRKPSGDWSSQSGGGGGDFDLVAHDGTVTIARHGNGVSNEGLYVPDLTSRRS